MLLQLAPTTTTINHQNISIAKNSGRGAGMGNVQKQESPAEGSADAKSQNSAARSRRRRGKKGYASENDAAAASVPAMPVTPEKRSARPPPLTNVGATGNHGAKAVKTPGKTPGKANGTQQQNRGRGGPRSGAVTDSGLQSPLRSAKATDSTPAFAGATFHASPDPSSLPIPSFLARARAATTQGTAPAPMTTSAPVSPAFVTPQKPAAGAMPVFESPLDFFFRADREEKQRLGQGTGGLAAAPVMPASEPPQRSQPMLDAAAAESLGYRGQPLAQPFAPSYQDRMRAARSDGPPSQRSDNDILADYLRNGPRTAPMHSQSHMPLPPAPPVPHHSYPQYHQHPPPPPHPSNPSHGHSQSQSYSHGPPPLSPHSSNELHLRKFLNLRDP